MYVCNLSVASVDVVRFGSILSLSSHSLTLCRSRSVCRQMREKERERGRRWKKQQISLLFPFTGHTSTWASVTCDSCSGCPKYGKVRQNIAINLMRFCSAVHERFQVVANYFIAVCLPSLNYFLFIKNIKKKIVWFIFFFYAWLRSFRKEKKTYPNKIKFYFVFM